MGYSEKHKGYRCLHQSTGCIYISRHVVFDENSFPFAYDFQDVAASNGDVLQWTSQSRSSQPSNKGTTARFAAPLSKAQLSSSKPQNNADSQPNNLSIQTDMECLRERARLFSPEYSSSPSQPATLVTPHQALEYEQPPLPVTSPPPVHPMVTRSKAGIMKPNPR